MQRTTKYFLWLLIFMTLQFQMRVIADGENLTLWYDKPADAFGVKSPLKCWEVESQNRTHKPNPDQAWEKYALPLGNGFIGAMVYGGVAMERVQFNEHSLWSGGPGSKDWQQNASKPDAHQYMDEIRKALLSGDTKKAQALSTEHLRGMGPDKRDEADVMFGRYQTFGELTIETGHEQKQVQPIVSCPSHPGLGAKNGGQAVTNTVDNNSGTKWCFVHDGKPVVWQVDLGMTKVINYYTLTSASDKPERDPRDWKLEGSANGSDWILLDERKNEPVFKKRRETKRYQFKNKNALRHFRFTFTAVHNNAPHFQLSEIKLGDANAPTGGKYWRGLDISTGINTVRYEHDGVNFTRESFCSNPDRCLVLRFSADQPGKQNLRLKMASPHQIKYSKQDGTFIASGKVQNNGLLIDARIGVLHKKGKVEIDGEGIRISDADEVVFILVAGTNYAANPPVWRGDDPAVANAKLLTAAINLGFKKLMERHETDHQSLFNRVAIDLGETPKEIMSLPIDQRVAKNKVTPDHELEELYFQFGRYLLIASSRPGGLPANLQGIWCNETVPAWNSDYHLNINLQMNYWPSGPCNLIECQEPLIDYIDALRIPAAITAKTYNNARGWTSHLSGNIWGYTTPHPGKGRPRFWAWFPLGGAWLTSHAWEQFAFSNDKEYLKKRVWPILEGTADYIVDSFYELPSGELSSVPSWSPEHGPISKGTTADIAMAREALQAAIKAAEILGESGERVAAWRNALEKLVSYKIGQHGQLQEWYEDIDNPKDKHRHLNHLFGLHPGTQISPTKTPELAKAAKVTLTQRGDGATGWSMGWR